MTEKEKEKKALEIEAKAVAICAIVADKTLYDIALILGAAFSGIIHSTEIGEWKAQSFAQMVEERINQAIDFEYNSKEEQPCSTK